MSLSSPLSVGDCIQLAKIFYDIAKAFTSGAKSAPAEFAEVQSLLCSMAAALDSIARNIPQQPSLTTPDETSSKLADILVNCRGVLKPLQIFVDKYSVLDASLTSSRASRQGARIVREEVKRTWKKVAWTTEGEQILKLKQTLHTHFHALTLVVNVMNG